MSLAGIPNAWTKKNTHIWKTCHGHSSSIQLYVRAPIDALHALGLMWKVWNLCSWLLLYFEAPSIEEEQSCHSLVFQTQSNAFTYPSLKHSCVLIGLQGMHCISLGLHKCCKFFVHGYFSLYFGLLRVYKYSHVTRWFFINITHINGRNFPFRRRIHLGNGSILIYSPWEIFVATSSDFIWQLLTILRGFLFRCHWKQEMTNKKIKRPFVDLITITTIHIWPIYAIYRITAPFLCSFLWFIFPITCFWMALVK